MVGINFGNYGLIIEAIQAFSANHNLVWVYIPILGHDYIRLCGCGKFTDSEWRAIIDPATGLLTGEYHGGHGGRMPDWVYDPQAGLFGHPGLSADYSIWNARLGMYPLDEFDERALSVNLYLASIDPDWEQAVRQQLESLDGLVVVQSVDYSARQYDEPPREQIWYLPAEGYSGRFALMNNREFVTDFTYDAFSNVSIDFAAMSMDGKWGLLDHSGATVIPFVFDHFVIIDKETAFAKFNGRYGILDINQSRDEALQ